MTADRRALTVKEAAALADNHKLFEAVDVSDRMRKLAQSVLNKRRKAAA